MINAFEIEWLKIKRSAVKKVIVVFPILVAIIISLLFFSTGKIIPSIINQWGLIWASFFISLIVGMIDRHEKRNTQYRMIISSSYNLRIYELGRILNDIVLYLIGTLVMIIILLLVSLIVDTNISFLAIVSSLVGVFITTIWEIPLYSWLSRLFGIYLSIILTFIGVFIEIVTNDLKGGIIWPFTWPALYTVPFINMKINGTLLKIGESTKVSWWTLLTSIVLFGILSWISMKSFQNQVKK